MSRIKCLVEEVDVQLAGLNRDRVLVLCFDDMSDEPEYTLTLPPEAAYKMGCRLLQTAADALGKDRVLQGIMWLPTDEAPSGLDFEDEDEDTDPAIIVDDRTPTDS